MVQKSGDHQLKLAVFSASLKVLCIQKVVTINNAKKTWALEGFFFCIDFGGPNHQEVLEASKAMQGQPTPQPLGVPHVDPILIETLVEPGSLEGVRLQLPQGEILDP